jgi:hypothetical protein
VASKTAGPARLRSPAMIAWGRELGLTQLPDGACHQERCGRLMPENAEEDRDVKGRSPAGAIWDWLVQPRVPRWLIAVGIVLLLFVVVWQGTHREEELFRSPRVLSFGKPPLVKQDDLGGTGPALRPLTGSGIEAPGGQELPGGTEIDSGLRRLDLQEDTLAETPPVELLARLVGSEQDLARLYDLGAGIEIASDRSIGEALASAPIEITLAGVDKGADFILRRPASLLRAKQLDVRLFAVGDSVLTARGDLRAIPISAGRGPILISIPAGALKAGEYLLLVQPSAPESSGELRGMWFRLAVSLETSAGGNREQ